MKSRFLYSLLLLLSFTISCKQQGPENGAARNTQTHSTSNRLGGIDFTGKTGIKYGGSMPRVDNVNANMFRELVKSGKYVILDVRADNHYNEGHINGAISFPYDDPKFKENIQKLKKDAAYLIYSEKGIKSVKAMVDMKDVGIPHIINLIGGIRNWQDSYHYPVEK